MSTEFREKIVVYRVRRTLQYESNGLNRGN